MSGARAQELVIDDADPTTDIQQARAADAALADPR
jgi:hypothetical protein